MRIGMILDENYPPHPRVKNEAINLIEEGHELLLLCPNYSKLSPTETIDGIKVVRYKAGKLLLKLSALSYTIFLYRWILQKEIKRFINKYKPDAIHLANMRAGKAVLNATKKYEGKIILDIHENTPEIMKMYHHVTHFPGNILIYPSRWKKWEKKLVQKFDKIVVVTDEAKNDLIINYHTPAEKIIIVPNSVQPSFYLSPKIDPEITNRFKDKFSLFYFGDTGVRRGLETAIRGINVLKDEIPNIILILLGRSKSDTYLKSIVAELKIEKYVAFEGFKDESLIPSYITASTICISPLLRNIHHDTTYANKIFQYMALGKPQVVSDCPAQKRIIEEAKSGVVHVANDTNDFTEKIFELYKRKELQTQLGVNGSNFIREKYNQQLMSMGLYDYYNSISN